MISPRDSPKLRDYLLILRGGWVLVLCTTILSTGLGWLSWESQTPVYTVTSRVLIKSMGNATPLDALYGQINAESRVISYQFLARSPRVTQPTIDQLDLSSTTDDLAGLISITPTTTPILDIVVKGTDPEETRRISSAVTTNLIALSTELAKTDGGGTELVPIDDAGQAVRDGSLKQSLIQAGVLGFVVSLVLTLAWGLTQDRLLGRGQLGRAVENAGTFE